MTESPESKNLPAGWDLPYGLRGKITQNASHQRVIGLDDHILMQLQCVPEPKCATGQDIYYWRNKTGHWKFSEGRDGVETIVEHVAPYAARTTKIERVAEEATDTHEWFDI